MTGLFELDRRTIQPGAVHLPGWLDIEQQSRLVAAFHEWSAGPVAVHTVKLPGGRQMSVQMLCLGWHWLPYRYSRTADDVGGARVLNFPDWLGDLGRAAVVDAYQDPSLAADYRPDTALVNFYDQAAKMGMHQDKDEKADFPVVSFSLGDSCLFRFGNTESRGRPYEDVRLASGDAFVFGGPARFAFHGVPKVYPGTADPACGLPSGRINITLRVTGLS